MIFLLIKFHSSFSCNLLIYPIWLKAVLNIYSTIPPQHALLYQSCIIFTLEKDHLSK